MRTTTVRLLVSTLLVLGAPAAVAAQAPGDGATGEFWRWALDEVREERQEREAAPGAARAARSAGGPAFCRSGMGHPVHGRDWCRQKGFDPGPLPWIRVALEDVRLGESERPRRFDGRLGPRDLAGIVGEGVLRRLLERAGVEASPSYLNGRWQEGIAAGEARVLQIRVVDRPLAEINDLDGDGRVDAVLLYRGDG